MANQNSIGNRRLKERGAGFSLHFTNAINLDELVADSQNFGYEVSRCNCLGKIYFTEVVLDIGLSLRFPSDDVEAFSRNLNAFYDWLTDGSFLPKATGLFVAIGNAQTLFTRWPLETGHFIEMWLDVADYWATRDFALHIAFELERAIISINLRLVCIRHVNWRHNASVGSVGDTCALSKRECRVENAVIELL